MYDPLHLGRVKKTDADSDRCALRKIGHDMQMDY